MSHCCVFWANNDELNWHLYCYTSLEDSISASSAAAATLIIFQWRKYLIHTTRHGNGEKRVRDSSADDAGRGVYSLVTEKTLLLLLAISRGHTAASSVKEKADRESSYSSFAFNWHVHVTCSMTAQSSLSIAASCLVLVGRDNAMVFFFFFLLQATVSRCHQDVKFLTTLDGTLLDKLPRRQRHNRRCCFFARVLSSIQTIDIQILFRRQPLLARLY